MKKQWLSLILIILFLIPLGAARGQSETPTGPVYIVQEGDTLSSIAQRFGVSVEELVTYNQLSNPDILKAGDQLVIPGLEGIIGQLVTKPVALGDTLRSLSRRFQFPEEQLAKLNHLSSPDELYVGSSLVVLTQPDDKQYNRRSMLSTGQSLLELAALQGVNPWSVVSVNGLEGSWAGLPGDGLVLPGEAAEGPGALPPGIQSASVEALPLVQGRTADIQVTALEDIVLAGDLAGRELNFFAEEDGKQAALQGVSAKQEPGVYPLTIKGFLADGTPFGFSQMVPVQDGGYPIDPTLYVDPATIDPEVTEPENAQWAALTSVVTPEKYWEGGFGVPVDPAFADCWPSRFGNRRSYNEGPYDFYHTGLDFCGQVGQPIYAPADGVVVFSDFLTVRGNATVIDHGEGVFTGYLHQSEFLVQTGDRVEKGQLIGRVGNTGRVVGPHLHWELIVGGVQVDPMDWLEQEFP
jgi:murein DD-endopeptidase MepM/ murein hydrolase activator NlpD